MGEQIRALARAWLPPAARRGVRRLRSRAAPARLRPWRYLPDGWPVGRRGLGWDGASVAEAYRVKWPEFRNKLEGTGPFGVLHEVPTGREMPTDDVSAELLGITYSYVLALAAAGRRQLRVMDWGGALGHYAAIARTNLPDLELDYHVKELPEVCRVGRELFPEVVFHETEDCLETEYDLVFASGALEGIGDWRQQLTRFARAARGYVYLARVPIARRTPSFVCAQRVDAYGYSGTIPFWVISRAELLAAGRNSGLTLAREFLTGEEEAEIPSAPEQAVSRGFLFASTAGRARQPGRHSRLSR